MVKRFLKSGRSGFYLAVSREGEIAAGSALRLEAARDPGETIAEFANRLARRQNGD